MIISLNSNLAKKIVDYTLGDNAISVYRGNVECVSNVVCINIGLLLQNINSTAAWYPILKLPVPYRPSVEQAGMCIYDNTKIGFVKLQKDGVLLLYAVGGLLYNANNCIVNMSFCI